MNRGLAHLGDKDVTGHTDNVADVEQTFKNGVVEGLVLTGANLVALNIQLDTPVGVLQLYKRRGTHDAAAHDAASYADVLKQRVVLRIFLENLARLGVHLVQGGGIGINAQILQFVQRIPADLFLFGQFGHDAIYCL